MADLIKKIKIKKQDGTFTDYIPIGANAVNVETSDGESVELKLNKKPYCYNTIADMKADTKLKAGDACQTLGYHSANDGGSGLYQIIAAPIAEVDEGSYIALSNNLIAKLVVEDSINVKQYGAYGDGIHDDTEAIQSLIEYLYTQISSDVNVRTYLYDNVLKIKEGIYRITDTIDFPNILKLLVVGSVQLLVDVNDKTGLWINSRGLKKASDGSSIPAKQGYLSGTIIDSTTGALSIIKKDSDYNRNEVNFTSSVGLMVGDEEGDSSLISVARCSLRNINIYGFSTGLAINSVNVYCITFDNIHCECNNVDAVYGYSNNRSNAGERITFKNCVMAGAIRAFVANTEYRQILFDTCSFDFLGAAILQNSSTSGQITLKTCHMESIGINTFGESIRQLTGFGYIYYLNYSEWGYRTVVNVDDCVYYTDSDLTLTNIPYKFGTARTDESLRARNLTVNINNLKFFYLTSKLPIKVENMFLADKNTNITYNEIGSRNQNILFPSQNVDKEGTFDLYTDDNITNYGISLIPTNSTIELYDESTKQTEDETPLFTNAIRQSYSGTNTPELGLLKTIKTIRNNNLKVLFVYDPSEIEGAEEISEEAYYIARFRYICHSDDNAIIADIYEESTKELTLSSTETNWKANMSAVQIPNGTNYIKMRVTVRIYDPNYASNGHYINTRGTLRIGGLLTYFTD